ncbi:MAG: hypothetical protein ACKO37_09400 [Vampirovibrionales bacterium]
MLPRHSWFSLLITPLLLAGMLTSFLLLSMRNARVFAVSTDTTDTLLATTAPPSFPVWSQHLTAHPLVNCAPVSVAMALARLFPQQIPDNHHPKPPEALIQSLQTYLHTSPTDGTFAWHIVPGLQAWATQHHLGLRVRYVGWHHDPASSSKAPIPLRQALSPLLEQASRIQPSTPQVFIAHIGWYTQTTQWHKVPTQRQFTRVGGHYALIDHVSLAPQTEGITLHLIDPMNHPTAAFQETSPSSSSEPPSWQYPVPLPIVFQYFEGTNERLTIRENHPLRWFQASSLHAPTLQVNISDPARQFSVFHTELATVPYAFPASRRPFPKSHGVWIAPKAFPYKSSDRVPILEGIFILKKTATHH